MKKGYNRREKWLTIEEMNGLLTALNQKCLIFKPIYEAWNREKHGNLTYNDFYYVEVKQTTLYITAHWGICCTWKCKLDGKEGTNPVAGGPAHRIASRYHKHIKLTKEQKEKYLNPEEYTCPSAIVGYNPKYHMKRTEAISFDINSAYTYELTRPLPITNEPLGPGKLKEGQVGYEFDGTFITIPGLVCQERFPLREIPGLKRFAETYYEKKVNAKTKKERIYFKGVVNSYVGNLAHQNLLLRTYIIQQANSRIETLINKCKKGAIYWNTDSITIAKEYLHKFLPYIDIGTGLGQFKIENEGVIALRFEAYQWNNNIPTWKGMAKCKIPKKFDLLTYDPEKTKMKLIPYAWSYAWKRVINNRPGLVARRRANAVC